jgi:hypothetical protein
VEQSRERHVRTLWGWMRGILHIDFGKVNNTRESDPHGCHISEQIRTNVDIKPRDNYAYRAYGINAKLPVIRYLRYVLHTYQISIH